METGLDCTCWLSNLGPAVRNEPEPVKKADPGRSVFLCLLAAYSIEFLHLLARARATAARDTTSRALSNLNHNDSLHAKTRNKKMALVMFMEPCVHAPMGACSHGPRRPWNHGSMGPGSPNPKKRYCQPLGSSDKHGCMGPCGQGSMHPCGHGPMGASLKNFFKRSRLRLTKQGGFLQWNENR